ncbi:hypothetical protein ACWDCC_41260 [Streptomyces sp. NPDC001102]
MRTLEEDFPYGKSSWSGFRDGSRLPPADLVEQVAARYLREPVMRGRQLQHGLGLLAAAQQAARVLEDKNAEGGRELPVTLAAHRRLDPMTAALLRLDDARLHQIEAMQKLAASERRREDLETLVSALEQRIAILESERDQAREETRAEVQRELQMSLEYRRQADEKLEHARRAENRARQLRLAAEKQVARERTAVLRLDRDSAQDTALHQAPQGSRAEELQLPPLHHFRELLDAAQEQLEAQDHELDDLGEQLGTPAPDGHDDRDATRIVWGQIVDAATDAEDVHDPAVDNTQKPVTSIDGTPAGKEIGPAPRTAAPSDHARHGQLSPARELVVDLKTVTTPDALSSVLFRLLRRTGAGSIRQLTAALPAQMREEVLRAAVGRWIDGDDLPDSWPHLQALVRLMGATDDEVAAFQQAYERIIDRRSADWVHPGDLADLTSFTRGLHHLLHISGRAQARTTEWIIAGLAPAAVVVATTAYTTALQAPHGPGVAKLIGYGALLLSVCLVVLGFSARLALLCAKPGQRTLHKRFSTLAFASGVLALPAGLMLPWLTDSDTLGQWFAHLIALM